MDTDQERVGSGFAPGGLRGVVAPASAEGATLLRKTLISTNPSESMFSLVRHCERNLKRTRGSVMLQRWLGTVLLYCEKQFRRVKGVAEIAQVIAVIEAEHAEQPLIQTKKAA